VPRPLSPRRALLAALAAGTVLAAAACTSDGALDTGQEKVADEAAMRAHYEESAQTYYEGGNWKAAERQWKKVLAIDPEDSKANWGLAMSLARQGDPGSLRAAEQVFLKIVDRDWNHPTLGDRSHEVRKDFAEVYLALADYYDRDVRALEERRKERPDDPLIGHQIQTQVAARNDLLRKAMPLYDRVLAQSPDNPYALPGLAKAHLMVGDDARGLALARAYIDISRKSQEGWQGKLDALQRENQIVPDDTREYFKGQIRGAREKELRMHLLVATVLMRNEDYAGAIGEYDRILQIDPARPAAYVERAQAHAGRKDYRKAIADVHEYLKITDPVRHRPGRIAAADLLDRYRVLDDATGGVVPTAARAAAPAPPPERVSTGSPDG
jgi:tetratricopeptide (TPR) repeat protein